MCQKIGKSFTSEKLKCSWCKHTYEPQWIDIFTVVMYYNWLGILKTKMLCSICVATVFPQET